MNASESWREDLVITARLAGGQETRTAVPALAPSVDSQGRVRASWHGPSRPVRQLSIELKLEAKNTQWRSWNMGDARFDQDQSARSPARPDIHANVSQLD